MCRKRKEARFSCDAEMSHRRLFLGGGGGGGRGDDDAGGGLKHMKNVQKDQLKEVFALK